MKHRLIKHSLTVLTVSAALLCATISVQAVDSPSPSSGAAGKKPNILVIVTDDVGWGDLGCYGGGEMRGAPTPNIDRLASEGMRFVNYYG
jgi:arylsulfatase